MRRGHLQFGAGELIFQDVDPGYNYYLTHNPASLAWVHNLIPPDVIRIEAPERVLVTPYLSDGRLLLHILDYQFDGGFSLRMNLDIALQAPHLTQGTALQAVVYSPNSMESLQIEATYAEGELTFSLPTLDIWSVVEIDLTSSQ